LVRDGQTQLLLTDQQMESILQAIATIVEELLDDSSLTVEAQAVV
jgi:coproporphyrinogen III oxidase-like Fe-S oxidoreductase